MGRNPLLEDFRLASDRVAFARSLGFDPDLWQVDLLSSRSQRVIVNASRQVGKSSCAGIAAIHTALYEPGSLVLCVSPSLRQSQELFRKCLDYYRASGRKVPYDSETKLSLELSNKSRILSLPGTEAKIRGFSKVRLLLVDEASRIPPDLYSAVRPMLAVSGGDIWLLSTPNGRDLVFFETWQYGGEEWERFEVPATDVLRIPDAFLEEERRSLPRRVFEQEYLCQFAENEAALFSYEDVKRAVTDEVLPIYVPGGL